MLVLAGPGSGKTFVIIQRIHHLIHHFHIPPSSILVISFSKASAMELKHRFGKTSKNQSQNVHFSTFHACFLQLLKQGGQYSAKDLITPREQQNIMKLILSDPVYEEVASREKGEEYLQKFAYYKNRGLKAMEEKESEKFRKMFHHYQREMHSLHKLDFDDLGLLCLQLFQKDTQALAFWQDKFRYILIDEFQDINPIQFQIIRLLAGKRRNLFVVGDDDQAIYSFRGASPRLILNFEQYYPNTRRVLLETNYRCSGNIVKKSLQVIQQNNIRFPKEIVACQPPGEKVVLKGFPTEAEEYAYLRGRLEALIKEGRPLNAIACIYRTNRNMLPLAHDLMRHNLPFVMKESSTSLFEHFVAKDILSYLQFFREGHHRKDFFAIMNRPLRYLSRNACTSSQVSWQELYRYYATKPYIQERIRNMQKQEAWINRLDLYGAVSYIRKAVGYEEHLKQYCEEQRVSWQEILELLEFVHNSTRGVASLAEWRLEISAYEEALKQAGEGTREGIQLITMHGCKGLEFPYVFLPDCNEGRLPHKRAVTPEEIEEERRMFYVAMTRAQNRLELLYLQDRTGKKKRPSHFLPLILPHP